MKKTLWTIAAAIFLTGIIGWYYVFIYSSGPRSAERKEDLRISADSLAIRFESDEAGANARFLRKVLLVHGTLLEISTNQQHQQTLLVGDAGAFVKVFITMDKPIQANPGDQVEIKGFCDGFLSDVVITGGVPVIANP